MHTRQTHTRMHPAFLTPTPPTYWCEVTAPQWYLEHPFQSNRSICAWMKGEAEKNVFLLSLVPKKRMANTFKFLLLRLWIWCWLHLWINMWLPAPVCFYDGHVHNFHTEQDDGISANCPLTVVSPPDEINRKSLLFVWNLRNIRPPPPEDKNFTLIKNTTNQFDSCFEMRDKKEKKSRWEASLT